ncbi:carboxylesterase/lipase family protein [Alicyclobacillus vulcanalis]|uniref:Carboxylic ester hydrolase n=1 Tax=Alicyclobacillus vulcanalis TaxID=252246 RepID=A0A1N7NY00_9BACL|nr:carboxylesterase/lipase family protein [Alicyclobacillus vulcanalis]SIT03192.1 para-nitrobenzyl esterase [Alicyclobacillus vulcanalis]
MDITVETRYGKVLGREEDGVRMFFGIPYAKAPQGERRFLPPQPVEPWTGVMDARALGPICPQVSNPLNPVDGFEQSEDCLRLNIYAPAEGSDHPVMVWIHGGAYVFGSGQSPWYDGRAFARDGVVLVTLNYRLGPLGFLHLRHLAGDAYAGSGNAGILDQVAALAFVRDVIESFGGNPNRVTVAGESAGAWSVATLLVMDAARGLFQQAILQSGIPIAYRTPESAEWFTAQLLDALGVRPSDWQRLLDIPADDLVAAASRIPARDGLNLRPVLDGVTLTEPFWDALRQGRAAHVPTLAGSNREELMLWVARDPEWAALSDEARVSHVDKMWGPLSDRARDYYVDGRTGDDLATWLVRFASMRSFTYPTIRAAEIQSEYAPVYLYRFDYRPSRLGAAHALEIPFVFGTYEHPSAKALVGERPAHALVSRAMHHAWVAFVHHGSPQAADLPEWPAYDPKRRSTMIFDDAPRVEDDPDSAERELWSEMTNHVL